MQQAQSPTASRAAPIFFMFVFILEIRGEGWTWSFLRSFLDPLGIGCPVERQPDDCTVLHCGPTRGSERERIRSTKALR
jgi:hypothetical protein